MKALGASVSVSDRLIGLKPAKLRILSFSECDLARLISVLLVFNGINFLENWSVALLVKIRSLIKSS